MTRRDWEIYKFIKKILFEYIYSWLFKKLTYSEPFSIDTFIITKVSKKLFIFIENNSYFQFQLDNFPQMIIDIDLPSLYIT